MPNSVGSKTVKTTGKKLLDRVRDVIRLKHYSIRTEEAYVSWIKRYILFHDVRHPNEMGTAQVEAFLTHLAVEENVAASTQNQAFSALLFLYREVLHKDLDGPIDALRAKKPKRLPTVLTKEEVHRLLGAQSVGCRGRKHAALVDALLAADACRDDLLEIKRRQELVLAREREALAGLWTGDRDILAPGHGFLEQNPELAAGVTVSMHMGPYQLLAEPYLAAGLEPVILLNSRAMKSFDGATGRTKRNRRRRGCQASR